MYFLYFCFPLGPCILAGHFVFIWDVQTLAIVYMTFLVYGQYLWLCIYSYVYGCVWVRVSGYVYGYRVSILREARFNKYWGLPFLGAYFQHHWDLLIFHETHFNKFCGLTPSRGPFG